MMFWVACLVIWDYIYDLVRIPYYVLVDYQWFRKLWGGHWEYWYCDPIMGYLWLEMPECTRNKPNMRPGACFGQPICEHWSKP